MGVRVDQGGVHPRVHEERPHQADPKPQEPSTSFGLVEEGGLLKTLTGRDKWVL